ncbi:FecR family protein [uncultured Draconibacterium sp.]|uniref:FecR family protein n=1 Tax=uncultured Draconibacterium sp. TaxID=1573823 RepID=UPI002AA6C642|nr:FecR family protein [uncultured Draconibacterium sp.]
MNKVPIQLILQSFENTLLAKEREELDDWLGQSQENRTHYDELQKTYTASGKIAVDFDPDEIKALSNVNRQISKNKTIRIYWRAAAAVILLLLASQFIFRAQMSRNWNEIVAEQKQILFLPDSSKVILAENASLRFPDSFKGNTRKIILSGTAYFEITKNPEKPFHINTENTKIEVLGTKFLVNANEKDLEKVLVDEGKVAFSSGSILSRQKVILTENEIGTWNSKNHQLNEQVNTKQNSNAWLSGRLSFSNLSLSEVLTTLENHFSVKFTLADESFANIKYSGQFSTADAENIIKTICLTLNLSYQTEGQNFIIKP